MSLRQYRVRARVGRRPARDSGARLQLLVLRQARWRLDIQSTIKVGGRDSRCLARVKVRLWILYCLVSRLLALRRRAASDQRNRKSSLCGRQRQRICKCRPIVASQSSRDLRGRRCRIPACTQKAQLDRRRSHHYRRRYLEGLFTNGPAASPSSHWLT